jgi:hypothetical protein
VWRMKEGKEERKETEKKRGGIKRDPRVVIIA